MVLATKSASFCFYCPPHKNKCTVRPVQGSTGKPVEEQLQ